MSEYKHGNWFCKPASEAEAHEIVERAVASGAERSETPGDRPRQREYSWNCCDSWGVTNGKTYTAYTDKNEPFCGATQYTIEELRKLMPFPGEHPVKPLVSVGKKYEVRNPHGYILSDLGEKFMGNNVTVRSIFTNSRGYVMAAVEKDGGDCCCFRTDMLYQPLTEREKWVDECVQQFIEFYGYPKGAEQYIGISGHLYDALQSGTLKMPEAE